SVEVVCPTRAVRASGIPARIEHEVIDEELASPVEEFGQGLFPVGSFEDVLLGHGFPGEFAALTTQLVPQSCELLFLREERGSRGEPFLVRNHSVLGFDTDAAVFRHAGTSPPVADGADMVPPAYVPRIIVHRLADTSWAIWISTAT